MTPTGPPCPEYAAWWQNPEVWRPAGNLIFTLSLFAILLALACVFVMGLVAGARHMHLVRYWIAELGCGTATVLWAMVVWGILHLPSCL